MKILITGASGFLGSWTATLLSKTHEVVLLGRPNSSFWRIGENHAIRVIREDPANWAKIINAELPDSLILMHWIGVENHLRNDDIQFENVQMYFNLLAQLESDIRIVALGSQAELGPCEGLILENQIGTPSTLYGKAKSEVRDYLLGNILGFNQVTWARVFSTYGNQDNPTWFLPSLISTLLTGNEFRMTPGEQQWSYLHVLDAAAAFRAVIEGLPGSRVVNVGNLQTARIRDLAQVVGEQLNASDLIRFGAINYRADQVMELKPEVETLLKLGWNPRVDFDKGVQKLISELKGTEVNQQEDVIDYLKDEK